MQQRALTLIWKSLLLLSLVSAIEFGMLISPLNPVDPTNDYLREWGVKHALLLEPGSNRLILVGGSNIPFGVDSTFLEQATGRSVLDLALHAGLGLEFMLKEVEGGSRAGDVIVLIPEYEQFYGNLMHGELTAAQVLEGNPTALCCFTSWGQWLNIVRNTPSVNHDAAFNRLSWLARRFIGSQSRPRSKAYVYRKDAFDAKGDVVAHLDLPRDDVHFAAEIKPIRGKLNTSAFPQLEELAQSLEKRGARLVIVFPPVAASYWALNKRAIHDVAARMPAQWTISTPEEWVYDDRFFFDTPHHLNREGRLLRTKGLVTILLKSDGRELVQ